MSKWLGVPLPILYVALALWTLAVLACLTIPRVRAKRRVVFTLMLAVYLLVVLCATVICRPSLGEHRMVIKPFWLYVEVAKGNPDALVYDIYFNILLLLPVGLLLPGIFPSFKWHAVLLFGLSCSLMIELLQYFTMKGFFQVDDIVHNVASCLMGWWVCCKLINLYQRKKIDDDNNARIAE